MSQISKQEILVREIKYRGVNVEEFLKYLQDINPSDNICDWDYNQLKNAVETYPKQPETQPVMISQHQGFQYQKNVGYTMYRNVVECNKAQQNQLTSYFIEQPDKKLDVTIPEHFIVDEGMLTPNYVNFRIVVPEFGWDVLRRCKHFRWLQEALINQFPDQLVPPLPKKTITRKFSEPHISKRTRMFELFLQTIVNTPLLRTSQYLIDFLSQKSQFLQPSNKPPINIHDYSSISGKLELEINPTLTDYYANITDYLNNTNDLYKEITQNSRVVYEQLKISQNKMQILEGNLKSLHDITDEFNKRNIFGNLGILPLTYQCLETFLNQLQQFMEDISNTYKQSFYEFYRFQREMQEQCLDMVGRRNDLQNDYFKAEKDLEEKKNKYFTKYPISKWGIQGDYNQVELKQDRQEAFKVMLPWDQSKVNQERDIFAYINTSLIVDITQYFENKGDVYTSRSIQTMRKMQEHLDKFHLQVDKITNELIGIQSLEIGKASEHLPQEPQERYMELLSIRKLLS